MKKLTLVVFLLTALMGCATTAGYEKVLNSWVGSNETEIVRKWGPPAQAYETGEAKFLVYTSNRNVFLPGSAPNLTTTFIGNTAYTSSTGGRPAMNLNYSCQTTFELRGGEIVSWSWRGNDCTAYN